MPSPNRSPSITLGGTEQVLSELGRLRNSIEEGTAEELKLQGKEMVKILKTVVPKKSGNLKKSIKWKLYDEYGEPLKLMVNITRRAFYGYFLEYGTSKQAARPFFFRNMLQHFPTVKKNIEKRMRQIVYNSNVKLRGRIMERQAIRDAKKAKKLGLS